MRRTLTSLIVAATVGLGGAISGPAQANEYRDPDRAYNDQRRYEDQAYNQGPQYEDRHFRDRHEILPRWKIKRKLARRGHHNVERIDYRRGRYVAHARNEYGRPYRIFVEPYSGEILKIKRKYGNRRALARHQVVDCLHRYGYVEIHDIRRHGDVFVVRALNGYGTRHIVRLDAYTGKLRYSQPLWASRAY